MGQTIFNEVPSGVINGVNKVFTTSIGISQIEDIIMDGAEYFNFTSTGNIITLADAPTLSIYVDYVTTGSAVTPGGTDTFLDIQTEVYTILGENATATTSTFNINEVKGLINKVQGMICNGRVSDELTDKDITCSYLPFLYKQLFIQNIRPQRLTQPSVVGGTTLYFNCTDYPSMGYLYISGNILKYTGKDVSNTFVTGVSGIELVYDAQAIVQQARLLPTSATFPMDLRYLNQNYKVEYIDFRNGIDLPSYFSVIQDNNGTGQKYIVIMGFRDTKDQFRLDYFSAPQQMTLDADICTLPNNWGTLVISLIVAGKLLGRDGFDMIKGQQVLSEGYNNLKNMYGVYTEIKKKFKQKIKTRAYDNYYSGVSPNQNIYYRAS